MYQNYPVVIKASCVLSDDGQSALLWLRSDNAHSLNLTVIHEGAGITKHELFGDESCERLVVRQGECIVILARLQGLIVAYGVFQVNLGIYGNIASALLPLGGDNLEVAQVSATSVEKVEVAA